MTLPHRESIYFVSDNDCAHPSNCPPPNCPVGCDDALTAWRLFLEVLVFLWHSGGGWYRNSAGVVVCSVGVEIWGGLGWLENCEIFKPLYRQKETREDCVSWLPGCKFSLGLLTHKFDEQCYLSRQSLGI